MTEAPRPALRFGSPAELLDRVGTSFGPTGWVEVGQDRIDLFADATGDHQWIHVDVERSRSGPFAATIAHGYLTLSLFSQFLPELYAVAGAQMSLNVGLNRVRFLAPVRSGSRIRATGKLAEASLKGSEVQVVLEVTLSDKAGATVCYLEPVIRYYAAQDQT
ncbi:MaoC family dehydratase [Croceicoccus bisphenolivorans]|uniref:MaoC family dehydratase n=1 Tax=Croceicoccus bisphenolivorans TaxID=1783232 RepID=UPI000835B590|nr:MaoC family dehydratase [Croceicoccus bisphenolivorans]